MEQKVYIYICDHCKKMSRVNKDDPIPHCCGQLMRRYDDANNK
ncbi:MAG TPA: hypothetical protein P5123_04825 [Spirochaetota bacterium]|nr:hypothetical protein [Spirochaetota bacterium]